ncbi:peptidylprolyl isomerase [Acidovorax sp. Leaf84]|nr:peptidylprolyl isomerase [Acidovorax sp. Leaf84]
MHMRKFCQSVLNRSPQEAAAQHGAWKQRWVAVCAVPFLAMAAHAAEPVLAKGSVKGAGEVQVTAADVAADVQRIPQDVRPQVLTQARTMNQLVTNLYTRRALAQRAQTEGLAQNPEVAAALALARDKVLSDALLVKIDKSNTPSDTQVAAMARTMYKAQAAEFAEPEQVQVRHILILVKDPSEDAAAKAKAQDLLAKVRAGGDFAALARENSGDPGSAEKGGDLGFFAKGRMVPEFDTAAWALQKPGDTSEVIKTQFGYHVLQLVGRKPAGQKPFEEVQEALMAKVRQAEQQKGRNELAKTLEETVKLDEPAIKSTVDKLVAPAPAAPAKK